MLLNHRFQVQEGKMGNYTEDMSHADLGRLLREWIAEDEHYSVVHFAIEVGMSKEELFRMAGEDEGLGRALDYAFSVQEYKVCEGVLSGALDRTGGLKLLETYAGWKGEVNILQKNEYKQYMAEADRRAKEVVGDDETKGRISPTILDSDDGDGLETDEGEDDGY
jgi:hypothetical protein